MKNRTNEFDDRTNAFDEAFDAFERSGAKARISKKYPPAGIYSQYKEVYICGVSLKIIIQILTATAASTLLAFPVFLLSGSWLFGYCLSLPILGLFEYAKHKFTLNFFVNKFYKKTFSVASAVIVLLIAFGSIVLTYFGTPIAVKHFLRAPVLEDVETIRASFQPEKDSVSKFWSAQALHYDTLANNTFKRGVYKTGKNEGRLSSKREPHVREHERAAKASRDSLSVHLAKIEARVARKVNEAEKKNKEAIKKHEAESSAFADWSALVTLILELIYFLIAYGIERFDYVCLGEFEGIKVLKGKTGTVTTKTTKNDPPKDTRKDDPPKKKRSEDERIEKRERTTGNDDTPDANSDNENNNEPRFSVRSHGEVVLDENGKPVLYYVTNNNNVREYTLKEIRSQKTQAERRERKKRSEGKTSSANGHALRKKTFAEYESKLIDAYTELGFFVPNA